MEVKPGYKQTEVGVIPKDWEEKTVDSVCKLINGRGFKPYEWKKTGLPIIRIQNLNGSEDFNYFEGAYAKKLEIEHGQLLFAWSGSRGTSFGPHIWSGSLGLLNYHTWKVQVDNRAISQNFFLHALRKLTKFIEDRAHGASALVHTQKWEMESFLFPVPPTSDEQRAIADALSDVDELLGGLDRLIDKKRDLKQAVMRQLLTGQTRLPGFRGEWQTKSLGDVISHCFSGATPRRNRPEFYRGNVRWITSGELNYNVITDTIEKISDEAVAATNLAIIPAGTFLMAITGLEAEGTRGACGIVGKPSTTNQSCMAVFPTKALVTNFLFYYYVFRGKQLALQYCQGTKQQSYTARLVKQLPIDLPPSPAEQTAVAEVLTEIDAELLGLEQRRKKTRALKQAMMQELLTGRTRLVSPKDAHA